MFKLHEGMLIHLAGRSTALEKNHAEKTKRKIKAMVSVAAVIKTMTMTCSYDRNVELMFGLKCNYAAVAGIIIYVTSKATCGAVLPSALLHQDRFARTSIGVIVLELFFGLYNGSLH